MRELVDMLDFKGAQRTGLLTRDDFRKSVFERDGHRCVVCRVHDIASAKFRADADAGAKLDAHHIIERRLFPDGGYYIDNGARSASPAI